jgi:hypothetical protein
MSEKNCKDCHFAKVKNGKVNCVQGHWAREYSLRSVNESHAKPLLVLPIKCPNYSPPEVPEEMSYVKSDCNRRDISRIINAVRNGNKYFDFYCERPKMDMAYWEEWE